MNKNRFEGWYFKHQSKDKTVAFIPGFARCGSFVQVITDNGSYHFDVKKLNIYKGGIVADKCIFSTKGSYIDLPGIKGEIRYGPLTPLRSDIMGPFRFFPMECRHGVISMMHSLCGTLCMEGEKVSFDGGTGYMESDSGTSFPSSYRWIQCNRFDRPLSIMLSIAEIPFLGFHFTGCLCAIVTEDKEYRLATYKGVKILSDEENRIVLSQGRFTLRIDLLDIPEGFSLRSPLFGRMDGTIKESNRVRARFCFKEKGRVVFDSESGDAGYEYVKQR
ncbi:MAG: tocopherol cyclase family protein [Clostridia bacterium]|jgi:tocopherol cyclase|nr:hypothetical protein [Clostridiaceae bacterium]